MLYDTTQLRRQDRALSQESAYKILAESEFGTLCLQDIGGGGYGIPLNYVWDGAESLYMHCASSGHKLDCLRKESRATFVVTAGHRILSEQFSTAYESVLVHGNAVSVCSEEEKIRALQQLIQKLTPKHLIQGENYIHRAARATTVIRFQIDRICGKANHA